MDNIQYNKIKIIENMMINIVDTSLKSVWNEIEKIKEPLKRCEYRCYYKEAIKKLNMFE